MRHNVINYGSIYLVLDWHATDSEKKNNHITMTTSSVTSDTKITRNVMNQLRVIFMASGKIRLVPAQDVHFFYTESHFSALQSCAIIFQPIFSLFSYLNSARHNLVIELCCALKNVNFKNSSLVQSRAVL